MEARSLDSLPTLLQGTFANGRVTTSFQFSLDDALERHIGVAAGNSSQRESQLESVELISFKSLFQDEANLLQAITPKKHGTRFIVARVQG